MLLKTCQILLKGVEFSENFLDSLIVALVSKYLCSSSLNLLDFLKKCVESSRNGAWESKDVGSSMTVIGM